MENENNQKEIKQPKSYYLYKAKNLIKINMDNLTSRNYNNLLYNNIDNKNSINKQNIQKLTNIKKVNLNKKLNKGLLIINNINNNSNNKIFNYSSKTENNCNKNIFLSNILKENKIKIPENIKQQKISLKKNIEKNNSYIFEKNNNTSQDNMKYKNEIQKSKENNEIKNKLIKSEIKLGSKMNKPKIIIEDQNTKKTHYINNNSIENLKKYNNSFTLSKSINFFNEKSFNHNNPLLINIISNNQNGSNNLNLINSYASQLSLTQNENRKSCTITHENTNKKIINKNNYNMLDIKKKFLKHKNNDSKIYDNININKSCTINYKTINTDTKRKIYKVIYDNKNQIKNEKNNTMIFSNKNNTIIKNNENNNNIFNKSKSLYRYHNNSSLYINNSVNSQINLNTLNRDLFIKLNNKKKRKRNEDIIKSIIEINNSKYNFYK